MKSQIQISESPAPPVLSPVAMGDAHGPAGARGTAVRCRGPDTGRELADQHRHQPLPPGQRAEVPGSEVTAAALRDAVSEVTAVPGYRTRLAALSAAARRAGGHRKAADALQHAAAGARALASQRSDDR